MDMFFVRAGKNLMIKALSRKECRKNFHDKSLIFDARFSKQLIFVAFCCDRKSRAAYAQSFAAWQQATIEITRRDHSIIACSRHTRIFLFFAHIPFVVNHTINATPPERL